VGKVKLTINVFFFNGDLISSGCERDIVPFSHGTRGGSEISVINEINRSSIQMINIYF